MTCSWSDTGKCFKTSIIRRHLILFSAISVRNLAIHSGLCGSLGVHYKKWIHVCICHRLSVLPSLICVSAKLVRVCFRSYRCLTLHEAQIEKLCIWKTRKITKMCSWQVPYILCYILNNSPGGLVCKYYSRNFCML